MVLNANLFSSWTSFVGALTVFSTLKLGFTTTRRIHKIECVLAL